MLYKLCSMCGERVEYGKECNNGCSKKAKAETNKLYDKNIRQYANVYANKIWHQLRERCKNKFNGLDIYSYYVLGTIVYGSISHHIETVEDNIDRCYDLSNLLYVSRTTHDSVIHPTYNKSEKDKKDMQDMLFELIKRWEEEFN